MDLKSKIQDDMKTAMRARETARLATIRLLLAAIKQKEVDNRIVLDDVAVVEVIGKMMKQRRDSIAQYQAGNRQDLVDQEQFELDILSQYMPEPLALADLEALIVQTIASEAATQVKDMSKVMNVLRPLVQGRADMAQVSALIKQKLS